MLRRRPHKPRGFVLLYVLLVGTAVLLLLAGAVELQYALHGQNRQAARQLQRKCEQLGLALEPPPPERPAPGAVP